MTTEFSNSNDFYCLIIQAKVITASRGEKLMKMTILLITSIKCGCRWSRCTQSSTPTLSESFKRSTISKWIKTVIWYQHICSATCGRKVGWTCTSESSPSRVEAWLISRKPSRKKRQFYKCLKSLIDSTEVWDWSLMTCRTTSRLVQWLTNPQIVSSLAMLQ